MDDPAQTSSSIGHDAGGRVHVLERLSSMRSLVIGFLLLSAASPLPADNRLDWPRFLGKNVDGVAPESNLTFDWTAKPEFIWAVVVGEGYGIGSVDRGRYYHFDSVASTERLWCLSLQTGRQVFSQAEKLYYRDMYGYEAGPRSTATVEGEQIFTFGVAGQLCCRNRTDGKLLWQVDTEEKYGVVQNFFGVGCSPLVFEDLVIVMVGGSPAEDHMIAPGQLDRVSPNGSALVAFERDTGKERWKCGDDLASYSSPRLMSLGDEQLVLAYCRDGLIAVDPKAGKVRWRYDHRASLLESVNAIVPVVRGNQVFISECYQVGSTLLKVSADGAEVVWQDPPGNRRQQAMRCHWSTPVLVDGFLYGCSGRNEPDSDFRCIDWLSGDVQWTDPRRIRSSVTRVGNHLLVLEERGTLQVIKPNPNKLDVVAQWELSVSDGNRPALSDPLWAAPVVVGDKLLVRGDHQVLCLRLATK